MEVERLQKIIKHGIEHELENEFEYNFRYMTKSEEKIKKNYRKKVFELQKSLKSKLDYESEKILNELIDTLSEEAILESGYYFERGVKNGITSLKYLSEYIILSEVNFNEWGT